MTRWLLVLLLIVLCTALAREITTPPAPTGTLAALVQERLDESGVKHDVTAVLLNFRGYDTLLELVVLLAALQGVRGLPGLPEPATGDPPGAILLGLTRALLPLATLTSLYLLWAGSSTSGGAFQAGAVLGSAGILCLLAGIADPLRRFLAAIHWLAVTGPALFVAVGAAMLLLNGRFLALPPSLAYWLILAIELAATLSIAATLLALFVGARSEAGEDG